MPTARRLAPSPALILICAVLLLHGRTLGQPFVGDDVWQIERLPSNLSGELLASAWTTDHWGRNTAGLHRPLLHTAWQLQAAAGGRLRAPLVRLVNLGLLSAVALMLFTLMRRLGLMKWPALFAGLVVVAHPASVEISNRGVGQGELVTAAMTLACLLLTLRLQSAVRPILPIVFIALLCLTGAWFKETMYPVPAICLALLAVHPDRRWRRMGALALACSLALAIALAVRLLVLGGRVNPIAPNLALGEMTASDHTTTALALVARYLLHAVTAPMPAVDHSHLGGAFPPTAIWWLAGLALSLGLGLFAVIQWRRRSAVAVAPIWLAAAMLPVLHLIPMGSIFASRHLWPMLLPLAWMAAWALGSVEQQWPRSQRPILALASLWLLWCAFITSIHLGEHRSGVTLWRAASARHPENAVAHQNLGQHLLIEAATAENPAPLRAEAREHLEISLSINPAFADAWASLGRLELDLHQWDAAETALDRALALTPNHVPALFDLGVLLTTRSDWSGARELWERVVEMEPLYPNARAFLARLPSGE